MSKLTKARLVDKDKFLFIFELDNASKSQIKVSIAKSNEEFKNTLTKLVSRAQRSEIWFNIEVNEYQDKLYLNTLEQIGEVKKEKTLSDSIPKSNLKVKQPNLDDIKNMFNTADEIETSFQKLSKVKCNVEKKGKFNYVSWTDCWKEVKLHDPNATFKTYCAEDGYPAWIKKGIGTFVKVGVTINNIEYVEYHAVTDNNKSMIEKDYTYDTTYKKDIKVNAIKSSDINTAIKRAMVKACAYSGLGLYVYQGSDLPDVEEE